MTSNEPAPRSSFGEAFLLWLKLGCINFGGPAGQIAMMHRMVVDEKKWVDDARFLHALNFCVLSPGPEAQKLNLEITPVSGEEVLRFAEPVKDLNPVRLAIDGLPAVRHGEFLAEMHRRLNDSAVCYAHEWRPGDVVLADNHALLHGRRAYTQAAPRHLRRVNIL